MNKDQAEILAVQAVTFIAEDANRLGQLIAYAGISPTDLRVNLRKPEFLAGVLDFLLSDEAMIMAFAHENGLPPDAPRRARALLPGGQPAMD